MIYTLIALYFIYSVPINKWSLFIFAIESNYKNM